jgi:DNA-directed RNA polymerase sigma subunit (sigma70/sigma32)
VEQLPEPSRDVIERRFGLDGDPRPQSHAVIARHLGRTPAEIRAIERAALTDLSRLRERQALNPVD